jgi:transcriptional regulator with XRE-family HTH domain
MSIIKVLHLCNTYSILEVFGNGGDRVSENQYPIKRPSLGEYLRSERERAGWSQRQFAGMVGIHYSYLSRLESGATANPAPELLQRMAEVLEIDATELLAYIGVKPNLPEPRMYFRSAYGLTPEQAEQAARLIEREFRPDKTN